MNDLKYTGALEFVTIRKIYGWLYNQTTPAAECLVDLYVDGRFIGTYPCNEYHASLAGMAGRNGHVIFTIPTPDVVLTLEPVTVDLRIHGTSSSIPGAPVVTDLRRAIIDTALSGMTPAKTALCRSAVAETMNVPGRRPPGRPPEAMLAPSRWFPGGDGQVPEYLAHQLHRLDAAGDFHLEDDEDLAAFLAARGADFGLGSQATAPLPPETAARLAAAGRDEEGELASRLYRAYARSRTADWRARPEVERLCDFVHWAVGQVRLPPSVLAAACLERLTAPSGHGLPLHPLPAFYLESCRRDETLRSCCDPASDKDLFVILLAVTLWLIRWSLDDVLLPQEVRALLDAPVRHEGRSWTGLGYFCARIGMPAAETLSLASFEAGRAPCTVERGTGREVAVFGYLNGRTALGRNARMSLAALEIAGIPVQIPPPLLPPRTTRERLPPVNLIHFGLIGAPTDMLNHGIERFQGAYNIGVLVWETSEPPASSLLTLELMDEIWAPSRYCAEMFRRHFRGPVEVMPHAVEPLFEGPDQQRGDRVRAPGDPFRFYFCFDELSWHARKNPAAVVEAFRAAFPAGEAVELVVKLRPAGRGGAAASHSLRSMSDLRARRRFRRLAEGDPRVRIVTGEVDRDAVAALMRDCDCYVSLHRSEGFGYTMAEAMMAGKPVIASRYSGNLDYMDDGTAFLVDGRERYMAQDEYLGVMPGARWFEPDVSAAAAAMRLVHDDAAERQRRAAAGAALVRRELGLDAMARRYAARLDAVLGRRTGR